MFNAIIVGVLCALMGIGAGYLILNAFFAGVRHIAKPRIVNIKKAAQEMLDNWRSSCYHTIILNNCGKNGE